MKYSIMELRMQRDRILQAASKSPGGMMTPAQHRQLREVMVRLSIAHAEKNHKHWVENDPKLKGE